MRPDERTTGSLVWHLALRWRTSVDRAVAPLGLTHAQYSALASLRALTQRDERPSQRRLAEYTGLGPIYVSKLVTALVARELVVRTPDPTDARAVHLALTERGVDVVDRAVVIVRALDGDLTGVLGGPDSETVGRFRSALRTLLDGTPFENGDEP